MSLFCNEGKNPIKINIAMKDFQAAGNAPFIFDYKAFGKCQSSIMISEFTAFLL